MQDKYRFLRFGLLPIAAIFFTSLGYFIAYTDDYGRQFCTSNPYKTMLDILLPWVYTVICSEASLRIFIWLQRYFPIETRLRTLIIAHLGLSSFIWMDVFVLSQILIFGYDTSEKVYMIKTNILFALVIAIGMNAILVGMALFDRWKKQIQETEDLKRVSLEAQNEALKQQIDPHFLFNSLNTLTALIEEEPHLATKFVKELSNVYRYVLQRKDSELVALDDEIEFVRAYLYLHELRFGDNIRIDINTKHIDDNAGLPPLALQMCIENAIKHNIISKHQPLTINITAQGEYITIRNSLQQKRNTVISTQVGLKNIQHRYSLLTEKKIEVCSENNHFVVKLPLIHMEQMTLITQQDELQGVNEIDFS